MKNSILEILEISSTQIISQNKQINLKGGTITVLKLCDQINTFTPGGGEATP